MTQLTSHLEIIKSLAEQIKRPIRVMEVCGTHTMTAFRSGLRSLLPENVSLLSGPGCPVCVTPTGFIDRAIALAQEPGITIATFGDLVRVPGTESSLERERARGARINIVYSALDAFRDAEQNPDRQVVFLGVGFETTAPTVAWTVKKALTGRLGNFSILPAHKTIPQAMAALMQGGEVKIDGFLCPGHVSAIIGSRPYEFLCRDYGIPCVVAGFEAGDMILAIEMILRQRIEKRATVEIQYTRGVGETGNPEAQAILREVFEECDSEWRGLGTIPRSGLRLRDTFRAHDAFLRWPALPLPTPVEPPGCRCGDVLRGARLPTECPLFRTRCTPETPVGACMVSSEGACAAYYRYAHSGSEKEE
ncbi:MAG: hydrogenase formation protein HypD [Verrucomicrobia bacterium]|nr:hydrogenase formation protein HypD [Verrucomicrobiota bacterium]MBU4246987.1 hydrogenase formation protein HypD [Verrucomicrobiota bacterium]MBU4291762.1 hydrogenase formation protein HypD [Verrucomicrobiota bacterium]MBU4498283.1 hydrogenase formation protein HypD [Verrucomicrobiota bacterium]MCG2681590.1 hydrogenase formation protein HypD [Kiritimatiellia bacterium]